MPRPKTRTKSFTRKIPYRSLKCPKCLHTFSTMAAYKVHLNKCMLNWLLRDRDVLKYDSRLNQYNLADKEFAPIEEEKNP